MIAKYSKNLKGEKETKFTIENNFKKNDPEHIKKLKKEKESSEKS
jgi:hypothetical protein